MMARALIAVVLLICSVGAQAAQVTIGSKNFTEAVILGEIATAAGRRYGVDVQHRAQLGGTRILWRALETGQIDAYAEYTGTLAQELLQLPNASQAELRAALDARGLAMTDSLGFQNTYAFGMKRERAQALGIVSLSDLARHPTLKIGLSNEFMQRADGWPGVRAAYALPQAATGLDHDLAYRALQSGAIGVTDLYSTDAEIPYYQLQVLRDDRRYFPDYQAILSIARSWRNARRRCCRHCGGCKDASMKRPCNGSMHRSNWSGSPKRRLPRTGWASRRPLTRTRA